MDKLFVALQYVLPQKALTRLLGWLADTEIAWLKNTLISLFIKQYKVDMGEAEVADYREFANFNTFFTRALKADARPLADAGQHVLCPADGAISQLGAIADGRIFQAKGQHYTVTELLAADAELAERFRHGSFATIYLSPRDYHRVHMPVTGKLRLTSYVPGDLFSVNQATADNVPRLFARNERLVTVFDTPHGSCAVVMVGAMIVAGIETVWAGNARSGDGRIAQQRFDERDSAFALEAGAEMGRFKLGSTAVLLFEKDVLVWDDGVQAGAAVQMGQALGQWTKRT